MKRVLMLFLLAVLLPVPITAQGTVQAGPWDRWENNYDPAHAAQIVLGEPLQGLNFVCPQRPFEQLPPNCRDTDWFWIAVRGGQCYTAETRDLAAGIDTNVIVFGPETDKAAPLAGNDNASATELRSVATVCLPSEPIQQRLFLLVGQVGDLPPPPPVAERTYSLIVRALEPTPLPIPPTAAPLLPTATALPSATSWPLVNDAPTGRAVVVASSAALRVAPAGAVVEMLGQGATVQLLGAAQGPWVRVQPILGVVPGWVQAREVQRVFDAPTPPSSGQVPTATAPLTPTVPPLPTAPALPLLELDPLPPVVAPVPTAAATLRDLVVTVTSGRSAGRALGGVRVQVVDAWGDVVRDGVTDDRGQVQWTWTGESGQALWVQLPAVGLRTALGAGQTSLMVAIPQ